MDAAIDSTMFRARYANVFDGDARWQAINVVASDTYQWRTGSTYVANPPYFEGMNMTPAPVSDIIEAKPLAIFADSITPTIFRRLAASRQRLRRVSTCRSIRSPRLISTAMARVAVITKS